MVNLPRDKTGAIDFSRDFFGKETFLTVSGQLNVEAYCLALSKVYTFGPTFRAENSTPRATSPSSGWSSRKSRSPTSMRTHAWPRSS
jgi:hypothetical protein